MKFPWGFDRLTPFMFCIWKLLFDVTPAILYPIPYLKNMFILLRNLQKLMEILFK